MMLDASYMLFIYASLLLPWCAPFIIAGIAIACVAHRIVYGKLFFLTALFIGFGVGGISACVKQTTRYVLIFFLDTPPISAEKSVLMVGGAVYLVIALGALPFLFQRLARRFEIPRNTA